MNRRGFFTAIAGAPFAVFVDPINPKDHSPDKDTLYLNGQAALRVTDNGVFHILPDKDVMKIKAPDRDEITEVHVNKGSL